MPLNVLQDLVTFITKRKSGEVTLGTRGFSRALLPHARKNNLWYPGHIEVDIWPYQPSSQGLSYQFVKPDPVNTCNTSQIPCYGTMDCLFYVAVFKYISLLYFFCIITFADIDECLVRRSCPKYHSYCKNTFGSYRCLCTKGYEGVYDANMQLNICKGKPGLTTKPSFSPTNIAQLQWNEKIKFNFKLNTVTCIIVAKNSKFSQQDQRFR